MDEHGIVGRIGYVTKVVSISDVELRGRLVHTNPTSDLEADDQWCITDGKGNYQVLEDWRDKFHEKEITLRISHRNAGRDESHLLPQEDTEANDNDNRR